ncbi:MarR family transcriptional regulator [Bradyrhizobium jicamae]|uniref:MarR family transcriptional regulator n=1 Tax=Bradyrhizobium jicamae TaxID=280332 RepID=A0ABS5FMH1_9BRAD|nr:helix-turn-helix domain-containing protein [Bradyrhizobium jicamae]MBR0798006.1 MarR family transcriptional regulator [Bradyrhizobium jicamae]MBR0934394.1 MarR family transcriptional regulator [Bradyrhizobium jicamae]
MTVAENILREVRSNPGQTEDQLAERLFGREGATQQRVNPTCRKLVAKGWLLRRGKGGPSDPYTYHLPERI